MRNLRLIHHPVPGPLLPNRNTAAQALVTTVTIQKSKAQAHGRCILRHRKEKACHQVIHLLGQVETVASIILPAPHRNYSSPSRSSSRNSYSSPSSSGHAVILHLLNRTAHRREVVPAEVLQGREAAAAEVHVALAVAVHAAEGNNLNYSLS